MANLNKVLLIGNLTRDPEVRYTPKGTAVCELGLAVNRYYVSETNEKREEVTYIDVETWGRTAENAGQYLAKGRPVFIEGRLRMESWDDKQTGQKRTKLKVVAEALQFLGGSRDGAPQGVAPSREYATDRPLARPTSQSRPGLASPQPPEDFSQAGSGDIQEDDIPF